MIPLTAHVSVSQGARQYQEDTHLMPKVVGGRGGSAQVMGVFDGHNGAAVAETCRDNFALILHQCMLHQPDMAIALREAFRLVDELAKHVNPLNVGSTAVVCVVQGERLWFANAGDSMAMIVHSDGSCTSMSQEHKAHNERDRIIAAGGTVTYHDGVGRVNGGLNLSRSIGDHYVKAFVRSEPFMRCGPRRGASFVVLASDGIWDVYEPEELTRDILRAMQATDNWQAALQMVVQAAHARHSFDNVTLMVVPLQPAAPAASGPITQA